ncbi:MAG: sulfotransferase [Terricaulis sp.]
MGELASRTREELSAISEDRHPLDSMFDDRFADTVGPQLASAETRAKLPDFLVIGAPRSGTTWLQSNLLTHPEVFTPRTKELKYFSSRWQEYPLSIYLSAFAEALPGQIKGEATPSYSLLPASRVAVIARAKPALKVILMMRHPVERIISELKHIPGVLDAPIETVLTVALNHSALMSSDYEQTLRAWLTVLPRHQILPLFYDTLEAAPDAAFDAVQNFLSLKHIAPPNLERVNTTPKRDVPAPVVEALHRFFSPRLKPLDALCRDNWRVGVPERWLAQPALVTRRRVFDLTDQGVRAFVEDGVVYAAPRAASGAQLLSSDTNQLLAAGIAMAGRSLEEAQHRVFALCDLDRRLRDSALNAEPNAEQVTVIERHFHGHVLCYWNRRFYAVSMSLTLSFAEIVAIPALYEQGLVRVNESLAALRASFAMPAHEIADAEQPRQAISPL